MVVIPAIDILGGKCVRLTQGDYDRATVYAEDPVEVVLGFAQAGAKRVHVVDLDAARGSGDNKKVIAAMLERSDLSVQVAGGVRTMQAAESLITCGAHWVVMGTAAVTDPRLFERCARKRPNRILAALDVIHEKPAVTGWTDTAPVRIGGLLGRWDRLPLAGVILTCIDRDGTMSGPDLAMLGRVRKMTGLELQYSGGVSTVEEIQKVAAAGAQGIILGKAIYEGRIKLEEALTA